jgi:hypothetical protein
MTTVPSSSKRNDRLETLNLSCFELFSLFLTPPFAPSPKQRKATSEKSKNLFKTAHFQRNQLGYRQSVKLDEDVSANLRARAVAAYHHHCMAEREGVRV